MYLYNEFLMKFLDDMNTVLCPVIFNNNTVELTCKLLIIVVLDLLCVTGRFEC